MSLQKTGLLFIFTLFLNIFSYAGGPDLITRLQSNTAVPVYYVSGYINAEGLNGSCKGIRDEVDVPSQYKTAIFSDFVANMKLDYKYKNFTIDTNAITEDSLKALDSIAISGNIFAVLVISGTYETEQDFSSNQAGFYLSKLKMRANLKFYEITDKNKTRLLTKHSKEICTVASKNIEHAGCKSSTLDYVDYISPTTLVGKLKDQVSLDQKKIAEKEWKKHKD